MTERLTAKGLTIDGPISKDLDDAIWMNKEDDHHLIYVSIADTANHIEIGSDIDQNAMKQCFTRYYATGTKPMIPRPLSEFSLSLLEKQKRDTITLTICLDLQLNVKSFKINKTTLKSLKKLSYQEAEELMGTDQDPFLKDAYKLSRRLFNKRRDDGAIVYFDREKGFTTTEDGNVTILDESERFNSHLIVQEFMILANRLVSEYFIKNNIPGLFRNHKARSSAPDRKDLVDDLENTLTQGNYNRINTFREKLSLVMERSKYEPTVNGHYGLNLPAYMHFTSPIRRYADMVNHRQLSAFLEKKEFPYDEAKLLKIAEEINGVENHMKDAKNEALKGMANSIAKTALMVGALDNLDKNEFARVIKIAVREDRLTPELEEMILKLLEKEEFTPNNMFVVICEGDKLSDKWRPIRKALLKHLETHLPNAVTILVMASQTLGWLLPKYKTDRCGTEQNVFFECRGTVKVKGGDIFYSPVQKSSTKKVAIQLAALSLLELYLGFETESRDCVVQVKKLKDKNEEVTENFKSRLQEICQKKKWPLPQFKITSETGESHDPEFTVVASIQIGDTIFSSVGKKAGSKKMAEQLAAQSLLPTLANIK